MRLIWLLAAIEDRAAIFDELEPDGPRTAIAVDDRILEHVRLLVDYPQMGRGGRVAGTRELVIARTPYIAAYRIQGDEVRIIRVMHGAREWPASF